MSKKQVGHTICDTQYTNIIEFPLISLTLDTVTFTNMLVS